MFGDISHLLCIYIYIYLALQKKKKKKKKDALLFLLEIRSRLGFYQISFIYLLVISKEIDPRI